MTEPENFDDELFADLYVARYIAPFLETNADDRGQLQRR